MGRKGAARKSYKKAAYLVRSAESNRRVWRSSKTGRFRDSDEVVGSIRTGQTARQK